MFVKATVSFSGAVSMIKGHTANITDEQVLNDLLACEYVVPVEQETSKPKSTASKKKSKAVSDNENKRT